MGSKTRADKYTLTHCLNRDNCLDGSLLLKRHSQSFKNSPKCFFGKPLNLRMLRLASEVLNAIDVIMAISEKLGMVDPKVVKVQHPAH